MGRETTARRRWEEGGSEAAEGYALCVPGVRPRAWDDTRGQRAVSQGSNIGLGSGVAKGTGAPRQGKTLKLAQGFFTCIVGSTYVTLGHVFSPLAASPPAPGSREGDKDRPTSKRVV